MSLPRRPLGQTGLDVGVVGFGGSPLGAMFDSARPPRQPDHSRAYEQGFDPEEGIRAVREAFSLGVNFFDTSPYYGSGKSEEVLGRALQGLPRDEVVVATKVGRYGLNDFDFSHDTVIQSVHDSLRRLQTDYLDVVQCHDVEFVDLQQVMDEAIPALLEAKSRGLIRHVGFTGLPLKIFRTVLDRMQPGSIQTVLSYCHNTLFDDSLLEMLPYLKEKAVGVVAGSPLSMGLLSPHGPPEWHPAPQEVKDACEASRHLCKERKVSLPKVSLHRAFRNPDIATTLVGMPTVKEVRENVAAAMTPSLTETESKCLEDVLTILAPVKNRTWPSGRPENN